MPKTREIDCEAITKVIREYSQRSRSQLERLWDSIPIDLSKNEVFEVCGAMLARQVTLAINLAQSPNIWNSHIAPVILRTMCDGYISLAWILKDPLNRSRRFIHYGLGQYKLQLEHRKLQLVQDGEDPPQDPVIRAGEAWIDSQRWGFLTEVDVGGWSDLSTRVMAEEANCLDFYRYSYAPFSAATHSMWHHIGGLNLRYCTNALHMGHKVPDVPEFEIDPFYFELAAKYSNKSIKLVSDYFKISDSEETPYFWLCRSLEDLFADDLPNAG